MDMDLRYEYKKIQALYIWQNLQKKDMRGVGYRNVFSYAHVSYRRYAHGLRIWSWKLVETEIEVYTWNSTSIQMHGHIGYADKCMFMLETLTLCACFYLIGKLT